MKKLYSSIFSVLTSAALLSALGGSYVHADDYTVVVDADLSEEELFLEDISDLELSLPASPVISSNYESGAYNYGDLLDANNKAVYNAFASLSEPTVSDISVSLPETVTVSISAMPNSPSITDEDLEAYQLAVFGSCKPGIDSAMFDMPEIYWIEPKLMSISLGKDTRITRNSKTGIYTITIKTIVISPAYLSGFDSLENAKEYGAMLDEAVKDLPVSGDTRYEQLKSVHDYIAEFTYYDIDAPFRASALGAIVEPGVVCEGYSEAFKLVCDDLGIPCVSVFGNLDPETHTAHMWNYVQMEDGLWYAVDLTWDDTDGENSRQVKYDYFLKGSKSFNKNHFPEEDYNITHFTYPELSEKDYVPNTAPAVTTAKTTTTTATTTITSTTTAEEPEFATGDLNHDGEVNVADLVYCQAAVLGKIRPEYSCDCNGDGVTDAFDMIFMRRLFI